MHDQEDMLTLLSVNWNQQPALELMLKSYVKHHALLYLPHKLRLLLVDNGSTDGSKEWLRANDVPFVDLPVNIGHEQAINLVYDQIKTRHVLLCDSDVEFTCDVQIYEEYLRNGYTSVGDYLHQPPLKPRIAPWFHMFNYKEMWNAGVRTWRDPSADSSYDTGSWYYEQMLLNGFKGYYILQCPKERGIANKYERFNHFGSVSWDTNLKPEHKAEIELRRNVIKERLQNYKNIELKGRFIQL